jgi:hypothetical protein
MKPTSSEKMDDLYQELLTWLYERDDPARAQAVASRLAKLLSRYQSEPESIFVEECRSLVAEAMGDLANAIRHRENEIRLIRRLHRLTQNRPEADLARSQYDFDDLHQRLNLLAMLYHDRGDLPKAISTLQESKRLCATHHLPFEDDDLLAAYLEERGDGASAGQTRSRHQKGRQRPGQRLRARKPRG